MQAVGTLEHRVFVLHPIWHVWPSLAGPLEASTNDLTAQQACSFDYITQSRRVVLT